MRQHRSLPVVALLGLFAFQLAACKPEKAVPQSPEVEINALLAAFERSGVELERNGEKLSNADAGKWFRVKWSRRTTDVRSAEDFIQRVAHHSSETKEVYQVVLADGTKTPSATWFTARLEELRRAK